MPAQVPFHPFYFRNTADIFRKKGCLCTVKRYAPHDKAAYRATWWENRELALLYRKPKELKKM